MRLLVAGGADVEAIVGRPGSRWVPAPTRVEVHGMRPATATDLEAAVEELEPDVIDVVVVGLLGDLDTPVDALHATLTRLVRRLRDDVGVHVLVVNLCTWAPRVDADDRRADRLGVLALELSMREGVSVVDVDRIVAETGARGHVRAIGDYDASIHDLVAQEIARILDDYGFFEARPLVPQVGREEAA